MSGRPALEQKPSQKSEADKLTTSERAGKWIPWALKGFWMSVTCALFILVAIGLEVMLHESDQRQGFGTPSISSIHISANEAAQFLKSFVPPLIFIPIMFLTTTAYDNLRLLQPYVALSNGNSPPEKSITVDYLSKSEYEIFFSRPTSGHRGLQASSLIIIWSALFSALAGSLFAVRLMDVRSSVIIAMAGTLGANNATLESPATFVAAAGNIDPGMFSATSLPPFVFRDVNDTTQGWMIPPFGMPDVPDNISTISDGTAFVNVQTQALNIQVECIPAGISPISLNSTGHFNFTAFLSSSCSEIFAGTLQSGYSAWIGVFSPADPSCVHLINGSAPSTAGTSISAGTSPVAIAFTANGTAASAAYCYGYQRVFNAKVTFDLRLGKIVSQLENVTPIPGHSLEQYVINGVGSAASGTGLALGDAVINNAGKLNASSLGVDRIRQNHVLSVSNGMLADLVQSAFLGYLLVAANNLFVVSSDFNHSMQEGTMQVQKLRIHSYRYVTHTLAALCALSGLILLLVFKSHRKEQKKLHIVSRPGTIGVIGAMLSSGSDNPSPTPEDPKASPIRAYMTGVSILAMLHPNNTNEEVEKTLKAKRFRLNPDTGALEMSDARDVRDSTGSDEIRDHVASLPA